MCVQVWIERAACVVSEQSSHQARCLLVTNFTGRTVIHSCAGKRPLDMFQRALDGTVMRLDQPVIATHLCQDRNRLWRTERQVPARPVLQFTVSDSSQLLTVWQPPFQQLAELLAVDFT